MSKISTSNARRDKIMLELWLGQHIGSGERRASTRRSALAITRKLKKRLPPQPRDFRSTLMEDALPPALMPAVFDSQIIANSPTRLVLVLDCRTLSSDDCLLIWQGWPAETANRGVVPVFVMDEHPDDRLIASGAAIEVLVHGLGADWASFNDKKVRFILEKFGAEKLSDGKIYARAARIRAGS